MTPDPEVRVSRSVKGFFERGIGSWRREEEVLPHQGRYDRRDESLTSTGVGSRRSFVSIPVTSRDFGTYHKSRRGVGTSGLLPPCRRGDTNGSCQDSTSLYLVNPSHYLTTNGTYKSRQMLSLRERTRYGISHEGFFGLHL